MYRIWDKVNKELNDDLQVDGNDDIYECVGIPMFDSKLKEMSCGLIKKWNDNYIVQQCTDKKSSDKKYAYVGDIISYGVHTLDGYKEFEYTINDYVAFICLYDSEIMLGFEIIGNIMEDNNDIRRETN